MLTPVERGNRHATAARGQGRTRGELQWTTWGRCGRNGGSHEYDRDHHSRVPALHRRGVGRRPAGRAGSTTPTRSRATSSPTWRPATATTPAARSRPRPPPSPSGRRRRPAVRQGIFLKAADILESRRDEIVEWLARETGVQLRLRHVPDGLRARALPPGGGRRLRADGDDPSVRPAGRLRDGHAQAGRRRRRDRALERGADPLGPLDRRTARPRQHRRARSRPRSRRTSAACYGARSSPRPACRRAS